jgi:hypothetical protein
MEAGERAGLLLAEVTRSVSRPSLVAVRGRSDCRVSLVELIAE